VLATISWGASTDADSDTVGYYLERNINNSEYNIILSNSASHSYSDIPQVSWNTVVYRVRAYDGYGYSPYITSSTVTIKRFPELKIKVMAL